MRNIFRIMLFSIALFWLGLAVSLESVNSMFVDFTQIPANQIPIFQFSMFGLFVGFMLLTAMIGDA